MKSRVTREKRRQKVFWMRVEGVCPDLFIYLTMYLAALYHTLRT
jgi:hypothetical protein